MAERRMFAKSIMDSDDFMTLPFSAQAVYVHLAMRADDDGFIGNAKSILRMIGAGEDDFRLLVDEGYLKTFDSSVVAIVHWKTHNYIQKDRYKPTVYRKEKDLMYPKKEETKPEEKEKVKKEESTQEKTAENSDEKPEDFFVSDLDTQDRLGKDSTGKDSIGKDSTGKDRTGKDRTDKDRTDEENSDRGRRPGQKYADDSVCQMVMDFYNKTCYSLTPVTALTKQRRRDISNLLQNYGHAEIQGVFEKAQESDFLCGKGARGWKASFDWLIKESNFLKVSEGTYGREYKTSEEEPPSYDLEAYEKHSIFDD